VIALLCVVAIFLALAAVTVLLIAVEDADGALALAGFGVLFGGLGVGIAVGYFVVAGAEDADILLAALRGLRG
jgi:hypothetical protein